VETNVRKISCITHKDTAFEDFFYNYLKVNVRGNSVDILVVPVDMSRLDRIYFGSREYLKLEIVELALYVIIASSALILFLRLRYRLRLHGSKILGGILGILGSETHRIN